MISSATLGLASLVFGSAPVRAGPLELPTNTWVAIPANPTGLDGACSDGVCKHIRVAYNDQDGLSYWLGGDHDNGPDLAQSGSNTMWTWSVVDDLWTLVTPTCDGGIQPSHPDEVGFAYDTKRNQLWMYPGFQYEHVEGGICPCTGGNEIYGEVMVFDVASGEWSVPGIAWDAPLVRFAVYDPVGDRVLAIEYDGSEILEHDLATGVIGRITTTIPEGELGGNTYFGPAYTALDAEGQKLYVLSGDRGQLYEFDLVANTFRYLADTPVPATFPVEQQLFWNSAQRVVMWPYRATRDADDVQGPMQLFIWHPDTSTWEEREASNPVDRAGNPVLDASGTPVLVMGRQGVYDPGNDVMIVTGMDSVDVVPYVFLYRYEGGNTDHLSPAPPMNLRFE